MMSQEATITYDEVIAWLRHHGRKEKVIAKQKTFSIYAKNALGIYHDELRAKAQEIGYNNKLAVQLFNSGIYEARILCSKLFDPKDVTLALADKWVKTFENWEICDSFCISLFARSDLAVTKAIEWSSHKKKPFEKRAGFVTMAAHCRFNEEADNDIFEAFFPIVQQQAYDSREHVKKSISWSLRSIGKRNIDLHRLATVVAYQMIQHGVSSAKWVGNNALKELQRNKSKILNYPGKIYAPTGTK